ncbi:MAG: ABC transporter permease [Thermoplasmata archaeon]
MFKELREAFRFRYVIFNYVYTSLKQKYRRSVLGFMWSVIMPLMQNLIIGVVFYYLMRFDMPDYIVYLFSGIVIYNIFSTVILQSPYIMINNEGFIRKIYVPKLIFVLQVVLLEAVNFILILVSLIILGIVFCKLTFSIYFLFIPPVLLLSIIFLVGMATIISIMSVYFRDMIHIVPVVMQAVFFFTPVLYPMSVVPEKMQKIIKLNPFYYFIEIFRVPVLYHQLPEIKYITFCFLISIIMLFAGLWTLQKHNNRIVFKL